MNNILKENNITIKSLTGFGNLGLKKEDLKPYVENNESSIKLIDQYLTLFNIYSVSSLCVNDFNSSSNFKCLSFCSFIA